MSDPEQVPIRRMDAPRPAPPATETAKPQGLQQRRPQKKRRQAVAGGSTVLAALFCLFVYCGVGVPRIGVPIRDLKHQVVLQPRALPSEGSDRIRELEPRSRSLQALESGGKGITCRSLAKVLHLIADILLASRSSVGKATCLFVNKLHGDVIDQKYASKPPHNILESTVS